jgi:glycosyltransferase involved in cell wall biosynthesis
VSAPDRIVFLTTDFRPIVGGVADHLHRLADTLAGHSRVTVMTSVDPHGAAWERAYRLEPLPPLPDRRLHHRVGDAFAPIRKLHTGAFFLALRRYADRTMARVGRQAGEDVAVVIGIWDTAAHFWCEAARRAKLPYYLFAHGVELLIPLYGGWPEWRRADFQHATRVIANSQATAALAVERFGLVPEPAVVNPSVGPRPAVRDLEAHAADLRRRLQLADGPVLLSVGRLVARKGFDLVLRSVADLRHERPHLKYVIAGDGPERDRLESLVRDLDLEAHVRFLGAADDVTKWAAYDLCDVFVMPNRVLGGLEWEGFGIVFLEAALAGRPAIGGRTGGAADAIADEVTGLLVDPERQGALTQAIRRLLNDAALRQRLGRAGEEMARTTFSATAAADRLRVQLDWN